MLQTVQIQNSIYRILTTVNFFYKEQLRNWFILSNYIGLKNSLKNKYAKGQKIKK